MIFQELLLIFLLGGALLGGLVAYGRPWLERVILFVTIPVAWLLGMVLLQAGVLDFAGDLVMSLTQSEPELAEILQQSPAVFAVAVGFVNGMVRVMMMVPVFLELLLLMRILYAIVVRVLHLREKCALFKPGDKKAVLKNLGSGAIGAVGGFVICMLLLMPIHFMTDLLAPTMETFEDEKFNGTYVYAQAEEMGTALLPLAPNTPCGRLQTYTGLRALMNATANGLCTVSFTDIHGDTVKFNGRTTLATLIRDGALGLTLYEYSCNPQRHTVGDFALAAHVIEDLAEQEALVALAQEVLVMMSEPQEEQPLTDTEEEPKEDSDGLAELLSSLAEGYKTAPTGVLQADIRAVAELLQAITTDLETVSLEDIEPEALIMEYLADEEATYRVVTALSKIHVYGQLLAGLTEYGVNMLGDMLDISTDAAEQHGKYLLQLQQVLNDRSIGSYAIADVNTYILAHTAEAGTAEALPAHVVEAYERYCSRIRPLLEVLELYTGSGSLYFVGSDGSCYVYDGENDLWRLDNNVPGGAYLAQLLLEQANALLEADQNAVIDEAKLLELTNAVEQQLRSQSGDHAARALLLADTVKNRDSEYFAPDAIYRQTLADSLKTDITFGENENRQFARIVSTAGSLFAQLMAGEEMSLDAIMGNFPQVGRLLDGLAQFEMTSEVSGLLLQAVMQTGDFGDYFSADSVQSLIEDVKAGVTTYEQLFRYVQSLYNILDQTNPVAGTVG